MTRLKKMLPKKYDDKKTVNYMGGVSFKLSPLETLKMVASSSMFMEPKYYQKEGVSSGREKAVVVNSLVGKYSVMPTGDGGITPSGLTKRCVAEALDFDFGKTLELALELREGYLVRVVPQLIMVMAAAHPSRAKFDEEHPGEFRRINLAVMKRADEPAVQLACWLYLHDFKKNGIPSVLKRSWKDRVEKMTAYEANKYKNAETGLINLVRICHAKGDVVADLMKDGTIDIEDNEKTWENLRSAGKTFAEIMKEIRLPHMALLRNLRNILEENPSSGKVKEIAELLKAGVKGGRQFPFRYDSARKALLDRTEPQCKNPVINDALEECIDIATEEMPKLKGKTICLSDNSGSAWGAFTSEYGSNQIAVIDNISSVIAARQSDEGYVGKFGDKLEIYPVSKRNGVLSQAERISENNCQDVGGSTENGIWLFFKNAIEEKTWYDNIFVFSDQQAGHGGLYGEGSAAYHIGPESFGVPGNCRYIDVMKLLERYRSKVNPKVNFFTVQTAGYDNAVVPEFIYRGAVLCGWTGKETLFASKLIEQWDKIEKQKQKEDEKNA